MLETGDRQGLSAFRNLRVDDEGRTIVFDGAGVTYYVDEIDWERRGLGSLCPFLFSLGRDRVSNVKTLSKILLLLLFFPLKVPQNTASK